MSQNTEIQPLLPAAPIPQPASWLGFKLINQAAANELGAAVLPSANSLAGNVLCALTDADGDALYVAGIVVAVTFTASAVRYSVAFPVAPQPRAGMTMYAVVENIESGNLLANLPDGETVYDSVLTEDAAKLMHGPSSGAAIYDSANPGQIALLIERRDTLNGLGEDDPLAIIAISREVIGLAVQVLATAPAPGPTLPSPPTQTQEVDMETYIKIAAESIGQLRRIDVYRVLSAVTADNIDGVTRAGLANYIATSRADLVREVTEVMAEEWPELGWTLPSSTTPAVDAKEHGELLVPSDGGKPKALDVPPVQPGEGAPAAQSPQRVADMAFLSSVVSREVDMWGDDLADKIEAMGVAYDGDAEVESLWGDAIKAYTDFMVEAMG